MAKLCPLCNQEMPATRKFPWCSSCRLDYDRKRNARVKAEYKERIKLEGCSACEENHPDALEVHHLTKSGKRFSHTGSRGQSLLYNQQDLDSGVAILLCANCHLIFHNHFGGRAAPFPDLTKEATVNIITESRRVKP